MKTFQKFIKENEELQGFLSQYGLEDDWKKHQNKPKEIVAPPDQPKGWEANNDEELVRDLNRIANETLGFKKNNFGIDEIKFEVINKEQVSTGMQFNLEGNGTTSARNTEHVKRQIADLANRLKNPLAEKGIYIEFLYNKLDVKEKTNEVTSMDDIPTGLVRKWTFSVIAAAVSRH